MAKLFTLDEIDYLSKNEHVVSVNERFITYNNDFKKFFVEQYLSGKGPTLIFESAGLHKNILGSKRIEKATKRWMNAHKNGTLDVCATLKPVKCNTENKRRTDKDTIKYQEAKIKLLEAEVELLKKLDATERRVLGNNKRISSAEIFELIRMVIKEHNLKNVVSYLCKSAGVSRSGYYNYLANENKRILREQEDLEARDIILKGIKYRGFNKGSRSLKLLIKEKWDVNFNRKKILRIMRKYGLVCTIRKQKNPYKVTREHATVSNHVKRNFKTGIPGKVLLTDISYIKYANNNTAYLSTILDAETKEILSHCVSNSLKLEIVMNTVDNLTESKFIDLSQAMLHSDQGWHYTNPQFQVKVGKLGITQSMSRRGNCWDNAPQESFFGHLKDEVELKQCTTFLEVKELIDEYIDYYNNERHQEGIKKMTPVQYRNTLLCA